MRQYGKESSWIIAENEAERMTMRIHVSALLGIGMDFASG